MIEKQIVLDNLLVNYYVTENPSEAAATVVFLHGWRSNSRIWEPIYQNLQGRGFALYGLDLPGFGGSAAPTDPWTLRNYAALVSRFIERLELKNVCLVGHSFGGRVAVKTAAESPQVLEKLVLVDSGGFRPHVVRRGIVMFLAKFLKPAFALPLLRRLRPFVYHILGADDYLATPELKSTFLNVINENVENVAAQVSQPTLIVWGEKDEETPLSFAQALHQKIPHSNIQIFATAGHFSFLDEPEEFSELLIKFINEPAQDS